MFLVAFQRRVQLAEAVIAEVEVAAPVGLVESSTCRADRTRHIVDGSVCRLTGDEFGGRVDHIEQCAAGSELELPVDEHALFAGQDSCAISNAGHLLSITNPSGSVSPLGRIGYLMPTA